MFSMSIVFGVTLTIVLIHDILWPAKVAQNFDIRHNFWEKVHELGFFIVLRPVKTTQINKLMLNYKKCGELWWIVGRNAYLCG